MHLYREFPPHPPLAGLVACLWSSHAVPGGAPLRHRVLPDNCIDILWQDRAPAGFVAGMMSRPHRVEVLEPVLTVAVRFLPGAARAFFDVPLHALQDGHPGLSELWPRAEAEALAAALWEREQTLAQRLATIERALLARLQRHATDRGERLVRAAVGLIERSGGTLRGVQGAPVDWAGLAGECGYYDQSHLIHEFRQFAGETPQAFALGRVPAP